jgi:hypothetical protein
MIDISPLTLFKTHSLSKLLQLTYPNYPWDLSKLQFKKGTIKTSQRILYIIISDLFPKSGK